MKTVSINLLGGLGNMLFQIATAFSVSLRDNKKFICDTRNMIVTHKPYKDYTENIIRNIEFSDSINHELTLQERSFNYNIIPKVDRNIKLLGYYQTDKYFIDYRNEVLKLFQIDEKTLNYLLNKYGKLLEKDICSVHIRRGDYIHLQNHHPLLSIDYYSNSIKLIGEDKHFLVFSDDIPWCENNLDFIQKKTFISGNTDYQDLYLISMCKDNIIANSSFSWWGAWLNKNENKRVISPIKWFGPAYSTHNTNDLYPSTWIKI